MLKFKEFIKEDLVTPSAEPNTLSLWHGGNLDVDKDEMLSQKKGRHEFGPGLYLTTNYATVQKYSKGSRKLYLITIAKGVDLRDSKLPIEAVADFINSFVIKSKLKDIKARIDKRNVDGFIDADIFLNILINNDAMKSTNSGNLRAFFVDNKIDYQLVPNAFGWGETMIVLFNMKKIINKTVVGPKDKIEVFDLPTKFN